MPVNSGNSRPDTPSQGPFQETLRGQDYLNLFRIALSSVIKVSASFFERMATDKPSVLADFVPEEVEYLPLVSADNRLISFSFS
jgi:hypothetical protein